MTKTLTRQNTERNLPLNRNKSNVKKIDDFGANNIVSRKSNQDSHNNSSGINSSSNKNSVSNKNNSNALLITSSGCYRDPKETTNKEDGGSINSQKLKPCLINKEKKKQNEDSKPKMRSHKATKNKSNQGISTDVVITPAKLSAKENNLNIVNSGKKKLNNHLKNKTLINAPSNKTLNSREKSESTEKNHKNINTNVNKITNSNAKLNSNINNAGQNIKNNINNIPHDNTSGIPNINNKSNIVNINQNINNQSSYDHIVTNENKNTNNYDFNFSYGNSKGNYDLSPYMKDNDDFVNLIDNNVNNNINYYNNNLNFETPEDNNHFSNSTYN